jgi:hypothetical protein
MNGEKRAVASADIGIYHICRELALTLAPIQFCLHGGLSVLDVMVLFHDRTWGD